MDSIIERQTTSSVWSAQVFSTCPCPAKRSTKGPKAGALAAVYSTPDQLGKQAAEEIIRMVKTGIWGLRKPLYPVDYSVAVNKKVARSLGFTIGEESEIRQRLMEISKSTL